MPLGSIGPLVSIERIRPEAMASPRGQQTCGGSQMTVSNSVLVARTKPIDIPSVQAICLGSVSTTHLSLWPTVLKDVV